MNENHARVCSSPEWAEALRTGPLPSVTAGVDLGREMLEIGPGPGAATGWLRDRVPHLTVLELDPAAAALLERRYGGDQVAVVVGDARAMPFPDRTFDSVGSFTMLHHVPTIALQDELLAEALRVLRPGGVLCGSDSLASAGLEEFHEGDTYNPVDPSTLAGRLHSLGFARASVAAGEYLTFVALRSDEAT